MSPDLSPTEWRRGATSLVARIAVEREEGLADALDLLDGPLLRRDPGIAMAMIWGLAPVAEVEPEAGEELLDALASISPISIADSVVELRNEVPAFGDRAAEICANSLRNSLSRPELDDGLSSLARSILDDLEEADDSRELYETVVAAVDTYCEHGMADATPLAKKALHLAARRVSQLESLDVTYDAGVGSSEPRRQAMALLRELDTCLLETRMLSNTLLLGRPPGSGATGVEAIDDLEARMARWLLDPSRRDATPDEIKTQATLHQRQLRTLLHIIDGASTDFGEDHERRMRVRARWTLAVRAFTTYVRKQPHTRLTRALIATVARSCDALVRDNAAETIDIFLYTAVNFSEASHIAIVAEASMHPDVTALLSHYVRFVRTEFKGTSVDQAKARIDAFMQFLDAFPIQTTHRAEAFRITAWTLVRALHGVMATTSLRGLVPIESAADAGPLAALEDAIAQLQQLVVGAERRCSDRVGRQRVLIPRRHALAHAVENAVNTEDDAGLLDALTEASRAADATLPGPMAKLVTQALPRLSTLQADRPSLPYIAVPSRQIALPDWLPPRRIVGGFYIIRQLGGGNVGTVFVVKRAEDRHDAEAQEFALKVPEYNATAARTMGEREFLALFREEAGALLSIPDHPNIATFVTFDAGARPKPILVMELIEGVSCERVLSTASLNTKLALDALEGVADGLIAMHDAGIAHLDVKPSNTILREGSGTSVLVDFGLAGRKIRPGCATLLYGAPEVWEGVPEGHDDGPLVAAADVYAFGCFAYEMLTSHHLFDGNSDVAIISAHITHDGLPPPLDRIAQTPSMQELATLLYHCSVTRRPTAPPCTRSVRSSTRYGRRLKIGRGRFVSSSARSLKPLTRSRHTPCDAFAPPRPGLAAAMRALWVQARW